MIRKDRRTRKWQKHAYLFASTTLLLGKTRSNTPIFATTRHLKCDTPIWFVPPGKQKKKKGSLIQIQNHSHTSEKRERRNRAPRGVEFHERALCSTIPTSKARRTSSRENKRSVFMHVISIIIGGGILLEKCSRLKKTRASSHHQIVDIRASSYLPAFKNLRVEITLGEIHRAGVRAGNGE